MKRKNLRAFRGKCVELPARGKKKKAANFILFLERKMKEYFMNYEFLISKTSF